MSQTEGAKFWLQVLTELRNRGVSDIIIACVDGLTGFPEAIETAFPQTPVQLCIVHQVRNSLSYVSYKDRKAVAADMKKIYKSADAGRVPSGRKGFMRTWKHHGGFGFAGFSPERVGACLCGFCLGGVGEWAD